MDTDKAFKMLKVAGRLVGSVSSVVIVSLAMKAITPADAGRLTAVFAKLGAGLAAGALGTVLADQAEKDISDIETYWNDLTGSLEAAQTVVAES